MVNENNVGVVPTINKITILATVIFIVIVSISLYSFTKKKNLSLIEDTNSVLSQDLDNNQDEISRMNAELDAIKASRPAITKSIQEQEKELDNLRNIAIKKQTTNITPEEQEKELNRLKSNATLNQ